MPIFIPFLLRTIYVNILDVVTKYDVQQPDFDPHAVEIISRKLHTARYLIRVNESEISIIENPNQTMRISGLYAQHLSHYMAGRIVIYQHISTKVFDKIVTPW